MHPTNRESHVSPTRPTLSLRAGADGVPRARQMVVRAFVALGRQDLVDCAQLGVSELVTNALLHVGGEVEVRVGGTAQHPRIEVRDGSLVAPSLAELTRAAGTEDVAEGVGDDLLLSVGRGLQIVARCSEAWGVDLEADGKVVWFSPSPSPADSGVPGTVSGLGTLPEAPEAPPDGLPIQLHGVPVELHLAFRRHFRELSREIRLLALAHEGSYPVAAELADVFIATDGWLRDGLAGELVDAAGDAGEKYVDLDLVLPRTMVPLLDPLRDGLVRADVFCLQVDLLTLARTADQVEFATWLLTEVGRQAAGGVPRAWGAAESWGTTPSVGV